MFTNSRICILCILIHTYIHTKKKKKSQFCIKTSEACKLQISSFLYDRKLDNSHILSFQIIKIQRGTMKEDQVTFGQRWYGGRKAMHLSAAGWWQTTVYTGKTELWYQAETLQTGSVEMLIIRERVISVHPNSVCWNVLSGLVYTLEFSRFQANTV